MTELHPSESNQNFTIDKEKFGQFVAALRKEKGYTQKELAEKLYVSDKAVSKWERALSLPDVTLLNPLAEVLGVTVTELLECERLEQAEPMAPSQVETLVQKTIGLSEEEQQAQTARKKKWRMIFAASMLFAAAELVLLLCMGYSPERLMGEFVLLFELLFAIFGFYFCFMAKEQLPRYYDENKIYSYADGFFRINIPVRISNRNWQPMLQASRAGLIGGLVCTPIIYWLAAQINPTLWTDNIPLVTVGVLAAALGPMIVAAKKYE